MEVGNLLAVMEDKDLGFSLPSSFGLQRGLEAAIYFRLMETLEREHPRRN